MNVIPKQDEFYKIVAVKLNGLPTELVIHHFKNKLLLFITQYEKVPNLFNIKKLSINQDVLLESEIKIDTLFGKDTDEIKAAIKVLVLHTLLLKCSNDIVISLALKKIDRNIIKDLCTIINNLLKQ